MFTVTMKSNGSTKEKDRLSRAIHAASIAAGYPEDDPYDMASKNLEITGHSLVVDTIPSLAWSAGPDGPAEFLNQRWLDYT